MLRPVTSKSISTKSHLVILAAPIGQGGHGAFDCVWGHLQSVTGSHLASGCPFTACGPRHIHHSVSHFPCPLLHPSFTRLRVLPPLQFGSFIPFSLPRPPPHCCPTGGLLWFWMEGCGLSGLAFSAAVIPGPVLGQPQGAGGQGAAASCRAVSAQLPSFFLQLSPQLCHPLFCGCV